MTALAYAAGTSALCKEDIMGTGLIIGAIVTAAISLALVFFTLRIRSSGRGGKGSGLTEPEPECRVIPEGDSTARYACGHEGPALFTVSLWGEPLSPTKEALMERKLCGQCALDRLAAHSARCALCGFAIKPGDPVALYAGGARFRKDIATRVDRQWMGCLRWDCCPSGGFFAGHWDGKQFVPAFDGGMAVAAAAFATGKPVIVNIGPGGEHRVTVLDDGDDDKPPPSDA